VNAQGIWPLEFTCRFGYLRYSVLEPLQTTSWPTLSRMMLSGAGNLFEVRKGFSVGVVLTTRPFPYVRATVTEPVGVPIMFEGVMTANERANLHFGEVGLVGDQLVTAGYYGWTIVVTGTGGTIDEAQRRAYDLAGRVVIPNMRYRNDIGSKLAREEYDLINGLGLIG
jgi:phosphoribosylamine--glycine ligase